MTTSSSPEYRAWWQMLYRCTDRRSRRWSYYGGRGITVCDRWRESFSNFYADVGPRPSAKHSIDRIDNDGNYEPDNCRWATRETQHRNKRGLRMLELNGETKCLTEWAEQYNIDRKLVQHRLSRGWSLQRALITPKQLVPWNKK